MKRLFENNADINLGILIERLQNQLRTHAKDNERPVSDVAAIVAKKLDDLSLDEGLADAKMTPQTQVNHSGWHNDAERINAVERDWRNRPRKRSKTITCRKCGKKFTGYNARGQVNTHRSQAHPRISAKALATMRANIKKAQALRWAKREESQ